MVWGMGSKFLLHVDIQLSQHYLLKKKKDNFLHWIVLAPLLKTSWLNVWGLFLDFEFYCIELYIMRVFLITDFGYKSLL